MIIAEDSVSKKHFIEADKLLTIAPATEEEYLALSELKKIEYGEGVIYIQTSYTIRHARVSGSLLFAVTGYMEQEGQHEFIGTCFGLEMTIRGNKYYAVPDLIAFPRGEVADDDIFYRGIPPLVAEIVTAGTTEHDMVRKREWYAKAGIPERWFIDPLARKVTVERKGEKVEEVDDGVLRSTVFLGLDIKLSELWKD